MADSSSLASASAPTVWRGQAGADGVGAVSRAAARRRGARRGRRRPPTRCWWSDRSEDLDEAVVDAPTASSRRAPGAYRPRRPRRRPRGCRPHRNVMTRPVGCGRSTAAFSPAALAHREGGVEGDHGKSASLRQSSGARRWRRGRGRTTRCGRGGGPRRPSESRSARGPSTVSRLMTRRLAERVDGRLVTWAKRWRR